MGSGNWIVDNLNSALATWNEKLTEIWTLISTSPEEFKGGGIWDVILNIHDALRAIGYALLVLFFVAGVVKTCGSFTELKRPEVAVKTFVRFALAQGAVTYGLELMMTLFSIAQGAVSTIMDASGLTAMSDTALPDEMVTIIEDVGFLESIPLWAVTLLGSLFIWVLSLVMILTVYSRFFKLYMATAIAPIPLASFAGQPSSSIGVAFIKSYAAICLEGCMIVLSCIIFANCKCKLDTCTVELSESERRSGWKPLASVLGDAAAAFGCVNRVEELVKQFLRGAVAKLLARPSVQFISCSQDILSRESLNGHALRNKGSKQPVVAFVLGTFP